MEPKTENQVEVKETVGTVQWDPVKDLEDRLAWQLRDIEKTKKLLVLVRGNQFLRDYIELERS